MEVKLFWGIFFFGLALRIDSVLVDLPVCLETALKFGMSDVACNITKEQLHSWFEEPPQGFFCEHQCSLSVNLESNESVPAKRLQFQVNGTLKRTLNLNRRCPGDNDDRVDVKVNCSLGAFKDVTRVLKYRLKPVFDGYFMINFTPDEDPVKTRKGPYSGLICSDDTECGRNNTFCYKYGDTGRCMCESGYLLLNGDCKKVDLPLGEECDVNEQCTGSPNSGNCSMRKCDCRSDYYNKDSNCYPNTAFLGQFCIDDSQCSQSTNNSYCNDETMLCRCSTGFVQHGTLCKMFSVTTEIDSSISTSDPNVQQPYQSAENVGKGSSAGTVAGVGIGGFVLGLVVSLGIMIVFRKRESLKKQISGSRNVVNKSYDKETEFGETSQISNTTDTKLVSHVRPTIREAAYSNIKCPPGNHNGDIYNHLNEKENPGADLDDYDHAHPSTEGGDPDEDYWHLSSKPERGMDTQQIDDVYDTATSVESSDNYFTLENRNVS